MRSTEPSLVLAREEASTPPGRWNQFQGGRPELSWISAADPELRQKPWLAPCPRHGSSAWTSCRRWSRSPPAEDLKARLPDDPIAVEVVTAAETEIEHFRRFSDCYSYAFFIVQPTDCAGPLINADDAFLP
jgi:hypothetical protein